MYKFRRLGGDFSDQLKISFVIKELDTIYMLYDRVHETDSYIPMFLVFFFLLFFVVVVVVVSTVRKLYKRRTR